MIIAIDRTVAIFSLVGGAVSSQADGTITYHDDQTPPSEAEIAAEIIRLQDEQDAQLYARNRATEYPSQGDQNDMIYKDMLNSTTTHKDAVEAVKTKWPKNNKGPIE
jgi:cell pole-organizing protein PopZ